MATAKKKSQKDTSTTTPTAKKKSQKDTSTTTPTAQATAQATEDATTLAGDAVHYHPEHDEAPTQDTALAAMVLHVADRKSHRVDLLVHDKQGTAKTVRDVEYSPTRKGGNWSYRST